MNGTNGKLSGKHRWRMVRAALGAVALAAAFFLVLPITQTISGSREEDLVLRDVDVANLPPPPPPAPEPRHDQEPQPPPPQLHEAPQPLDLSALELALNPGMVGGSGSGFPARLDAIDTKLGEVAQLFSLAELDQGPRAVVQVSPTMTPRMRKLGGGTVFVLFTVNEQGRVEEPCVQSPGEPMFDSAAVAAVRQWRFEAGKRKGQPVRCRVRQPITFPK